MKAVTVKQPGGPEQLQMSEQTQPSPDKGEVLVEVKAAAVNRTDLINRQSRNGYMKSPILGVEVAGVVVETGSDVNIDIGTPVMGLVNGGGYAEYAVMPVERAMTIPDNLSFVEAAAIPEVFLTAYQTLFWIGKLQADEHVLIHAGGSGVGTAAIQLAKHITGSQVITTAGSKRKLDVCKELGADIGINYKEENFDEVVLKQTGDKGVQLILDFIGASYWRQNLSSISVDGRWVLIGFLGGNILDNVDLMDLMSKRIQLTGTLLTPRSDAYKAALTKEFASRTMNLFASGQLRPIVDTVFAFNEVQYAHEHMEGNKNIGKVILQWE
ncbi:MAG TPA: NAD(P)H-quinone oxidoreductase [Virgibacillus sp.]|nr:NAD(P)H-quinone oxidoreductase [Virgibacillus sp.]